MPLRTLVHDGTEWTVWNVVPSLETRVHLPLAPATGAGWLCFQSATEKRRITPVPPGWEDWPDEELLERLQAAAVVAAAPPLSSVDSQHDQVGETMRRARDLGERVRRATQPEAIPNSDGWRERGPDEDEDRLDGF
jgi:hypothetical protein